MLKLKRIINTFFTNENENLKYNNREFKNSYLRADLQIILVISVNDKSMFQNGSISRFIANPYYFVVRCPACTDTEK